MTQALAQQHKVETQKILCRYCNNTNRVQVARIENLPADYFERVFFPGDSFVFATFPHAWLDIYTGELCSALLAERILCDRLRLPKMCL